MPRPKRIPKRAPDATAAASSTAPISAIPTHVSSPKSQRSQTTSDDSDGLVTKRPGVANKRNPLYRMSGAAAPDEVIQDGKRLKPIRGPEKKELNRLAREDEASTRAIDALRRRMQEQEAAKEKTSKNGPQQQTKAHSTASARPAPPATLQVQRSQPDPDHEVEIARSVAPGSVLKKGTSTVPMSARKPMSTPRAEASMMALHNFQRRKRAPSILGIGTNEDETASISSEGSFGDLDVDDESTPFQTRRLGALRAGQTVSPPSFDNAEPRTSSSRKRKRGSIEPHVPNSQPDDSIAVLPRSSPVRASGLASEEPASSDESLPELPTEQPKDSSHTPSSTMAPPESSSPTKPASQSARRREPSPLQARQSRKKNAAPAQGLASNWNRSRGAKKSSGVPDTAMLQDLLPKRRQRARDNEFSIWGTDTPGGTSDDDELSFAPSKKRAKSDGSRPALGSKRTPVTDSRSANKNRKGTAKGVTPLSNSRGSRTYSRRQSDKENSTALSDDENDDPSLDVDDSVEVNDQAKRQSRIKQTQKLKAMAQKFAEVDTWEMEYEEVTGSSDTFKNAR